MFVFFLSGDFVVHVVLQLPQGSVLPSTIAEPEDESDESVISQRLVYKKEGVLFLQCNIPFPQSFNFIDSYGMPEKIELI